MRLVPLPLRSPVRVVEPVPPLATWRTPAVPRVSVPAENVRPEEKAVDPTTPVALVERSTDGVPRVRLVVEAVEKKPVVAVKSVEEALVKLVCAVWVEEAFEM